ncbi:MAG: heme exporter protein CcmB [Armatimonadetes bacterium]|nr:heme exporter protein CcmB [Armatimonadota bacterium]
MKSTWDSEIRAMVRKELQCEFRNRSGLYSGLLLSLTTVFVMSFAFYGRTLTGEGAAGMLWAALLFAGVGSLNRAFVAEDENGTGDLLRLWARPYSVYWGKMIFAFLVMTVTAFLVTLLFVVTSSLDVKSPLLLVTSLVGGCGCLAEIVTLSSAIVSRGNSRSALAGVVALPQLIPLVALGAGATRAAFGVGDLGNGFFTCVGIWAYTLLVVSLGPHVFAAIWKDS